MRAVLAVLALSSVASAQPGAATGLPRPDDASGVATEDAPTSADRLRWLPRSLLFVPRLAVWAIGQPIRAGAYAYEHYNLPGRFRDTFFNVDGTFGIYPVATYESGFGVTAGARLVHKDVLGEGERLKLRVDVGGRYRQAYGINLRSGRRLGPLAIELDSSYERRPNEKFFGIGNGDELAAPPATPLDPTAADVAIASRFREDIVRNVAAADIRLVGALRTRTSAALMMRAFAGDGSDEDIRDNFQTDRLVGFDAGVRTLYVEQQLVFDSRRPASIYQSTALDGTGWLASVHAGVTRGIGDDPSRFVTYGGELQRYFDLYRGSRTLALRVLVEGVAGDQENIPFIELPRLGGAEYLRGYANARFRDRVIALGTAEYAWDLGNYLAAYLFVDVGRTYRSPAELAADDLRIGYGGGLQAHTAHSFLTRVQIAASRDGDVFLQLALSPSVARRERAGRF